MSRKTPHFINADCSIPMIPDSEVNNLNDYDWCWEKYFQQIKKKSIKPQLKPNKAANILFIADLHSDILPEYFLQNIFEASKAVDACIFLGDISEENLTIILGIINDGIPVYGVLGNHDIESLYLGTRVKDLHQNTVIINNLSCSGINGSVKYNAYCHNTFSQRDSINIARETPPADILISHDIPYSPAWPGSASHKGLIGLTQYIFSYGVPFNVHGHLHNSKISFLSKRNLCIGIYPAAIVCFDRGKYQIQNISYN